jgi:enoyl-CoA hydratase/carnithine racemase
MRAPGEVRVELAGAVAHVWLATPGRRNAIGAAMWRRIAELFGDWAREPGELRVVVLRGAEGHFAGGADIAEFPALRRDRESGRRYHEELIAPALAAVRACPVPVIAAIEGACVGGGLELAMAADLRLATQSARLGAPVGRLGFPLARSELADLLACVRRDVAFELLVEGRLLDAAEACAKGLVTRVVPADTLDAEVAACCARIFAGSALAARLNKANLAAAPLPPDDYAWLETEDYREGVAAFLAGRAPRFTGR